MTVHSVGRDPYLKWVLDPINPSNAEKNNAQTATDHSESVRIQHRGTAEAMPAPAVPGSSQTTCSTYFSQTTQHTVLQFHSGILRSYNSTKPQTPTQHEHGPPQQGHRPAAHKRAESPNATTTVQQLDKPLTLRHIPDNHQLPRGGNHARSSATTWQLPTGAIKWKKILWRIAMVVSMRLLTPHQVQP